MFSRLLIATVLLTWFAPLAQAGQVDPSSYCYTDEPADWSDKNGRWLIINQMDSPIVLTLVDKSQSVTVVTPGPETGVEKPLKARVRTDRVSDGSYQREWMNVLPSGAHCYGVFDVDDFVDKAHAGTTIVIRATRLHRSSTVPFMEEEFRVVDQGDLKATKDTYDMDFHPNPRVSQYTWNVTPVRMSRSQL